MRPCFRSAPDGRRAAVNALLSSGIKQHRFGQEGIELGPPTLDRGRNGRFEQVPRPSAVAAAAFSGSGERALKPHLVETLRVSRDKNFAAELTDWSGSTLIRWTRHWSCALTIGTKSRRSTVLSSACT
jgi:hypothetical protein